MSEGLNLLIRGRALPKTRFVSKHNYLSDHTPPHLSFLRPLFTTHYTNIDNLDDQKRMKQIRSNESELSIDNDKHQRHLESYSINTFAFHVRDPNLSHGH